MTLTYNFSGCFWLISPSLSRERFIEKVGAGTGLSLKMFSRMYNCIYSELIDVNEEFEKYYSFEYYSLELFLYKKYNLDVDDIDKLMIAKRENPHCNLYRKDNYSYGDYGLTAFIFSETMYDRIQKILMQKTK